jgi:two-component system response regulator DegU
MNTRIRLLIADDHPLVVDGLQGYFRAHPDFEVVAVTSSLTEVEPLVEAHLPDILIIDYHFANEKATGLDVCKRLQAKHPALGIIVASSFSDVSLIRDFINAGAKGYLLKTASQQEFIDAVKSVFAGGEFFSHDTRDLLIKHRLSGGKPIGYGLPAPRKRFCDSSLRGTPPPRLQNGCSARKPPSTRTGKAYWPNSR